MNYVNLMMDCIYILVNWTCNCSLYNTLVLVVYITLLSECGPERWSRGVRRDYLAFLAQVGRGSFGNANAGWNTRKQTVLVEFEFFGRKTYCRGGSRLNRPYK